MELDVHFIQDLVFEHKLEARYVPTSAQPADLLTKALLMDRFCMLHAKLTMEDSICLA